MKTLTQALREIVEQHNDIQYMNLERCRKQTELRILVEHVLQKYEGWDSEEIVVTDSKGQSWLVTVDFDNRQLVSIYSISVYTEPSGKGKTDA